MISPISIMLMSQQGASSNARLTSWDNSLSGTKLTAPVLSAYNTFWNSCDGNPNVSNKADFLHVSLGLATNEQHLKPFITSSGNDGVAYNSPTFATTGMTYNGTNSYVDWKWKASSNGSNYQVNNAANLIFIKTSGTGGCAFGVLENGVEDSLLFPSASGNCYFSANTLWNAGQGVYATAPVNKLYFSFRTGAANIELFLDNTNVASQSFASGAMSTLNVLEGCFNNNLTPSSFYNGEICVRGKVAGNFDVASFRTYLYQLASDLGITL